MPEVPVVSNSEALKAEGDISELGIVAAAIKYDEEGRERYLNEPAIDSSGNRIFHCETD